MTSKHSRGVAPSPPKTRVYLLEDHVLMRDALKALIASAGDFDVCGASGDVATAMRDIAHLRPDLTIVDLSLRAESGMDLIKKIKRRHLSTRICVFSISDESSYAKRALEAGATGCLSKHLSPPRVVEALRKIAKGETVISSDIWETTSPALSDDLSTKSNLPLTDKQLEIARCIGLGLTGQAIASHLKISLRAVEVHRRSLQKKLDLKSGPELLQFCYKLVRGSIPNPIDTPDSRVNS